jgi:tRNA(Ile)-lysidine synthase
MKKKTLQTITKHNLIEKGMHIVLGLSGGPDSVCLFDLLRNVADEFELKLYAVHVNHKFRPGAAEEDQQYVEELCKKHQVPCYTYVTDCNVLAESEGLTSEEYIKKALKALF